MAIRILSRLVSAAIRRKAGKRDSKQQRMRDGSLFIRASYFVDVRNQQRKCKYLQVPDALLDLCHANRE